ncbi:MAG: OmpA family protein [Pseudomonadota bacterium]|nr:OmpA family protein [Pseudomonadota bacterium]MDP1903011.1 OmpA family protein [Pseudomonadota bacterium]MDP2352217.1 OmpA family protein [Pseudomonadota bacterium]
MKTFAKLLVVAVLLSGCATKEYVQEQLKPLIKRADSLDNRVTTTDAAITSSNTGLAATSKRVDDSVITLKVHADRLGKNEADIAQISKTAQDALERAAAAGRLAAGKLAYEVVLSEDKVKFGSSKTVLGKDAMAALDEFAATIKRDNRIVFIEVQGHTDSIGSEAVNLKVGQQRAEAVRLYLYSKAGFPLHRLSAISYGESMPVASNMYNPGRAQNRRVVLVVLY